MALTEAVVERVTSTVAAAALTAVLGAAFITWDRAADAASAVVAMAARIDRLETFATVGERFTAGDGRELADRVSEMDARFREHQAWGKEWVEGAVRRQLVCERRLSELESDMKTIERRLQGRVPENGGDPVPNNLRKLH